MLYLPECIESLLDMIEEMSFPANVKAYEFKYHIDVGILVKVPWKGLPVIPIFGDWLQKGTGLDWVVQSIYGTENSDNEFNYMVTFLLAEEI